MNSQVKNEIVLKCQENPIIELCGLIYSVQPNGAIHWCENIAENPETDFEISSNDYLEAMRRGEILGVFHSHPKLPSAFSPNDLESAEESLLPQWVYCVESGEWSEYLPTGYSVQIERRPFLWGFDDCYGAIRHYFREKHRVFLGDYDRDDSFMNTMTNVYLENFEREGFVKLPSLNDARLEDVILFRGRSNFPQHVAVLKEGNRIFHHPCGALSRIDSLSGDWMKRVHSIFRHKSMV